MSHGFFYSVQMKYSVLCTGLFRHERPTGENMRWIVVAGVSVLLGSCGIENLPIVGMVTSDLTFSVLVDREQHRCP